MRVAHGEQRVALGGASDGLQGGLTAGDELCQVHPLATQAIQYDPCRLQDALLPLLGLVGVGQPQLMREVQLRGEPLQGFDVLPGAQLERLP